MGKSKAPKQPDPVKVAAAQTESNIATAREQARLGMTGQSSDFGTVEWVVDPNSPSGYRSVQTLAPAEQKLLDQQRGLRSQLGDTTGAALGNVNSLITGGPFDLSAARGNEISDIQKTFLDPQWENERKALESRLLNQGVRPGSPQYENQMRQFSQSKDDAYNKMFLDAFQVANTAALTERNLPLTDYATLMGFNQPVGNAAPAANVPTPGVAPTDVIGPTYNSFNAANQQYQAQQGGLFGLAGTLGSAAIKASDIRVKEDIKRVDTAANGLPVYSFRYKGGEDEHVGFMAQDVALLHPAAIHSIGGVLHVDYMMAGM